LGCEHAPYAKIRGQFAHLGNLINPFPILCKDTYSRIEEIVAKDPLMSERNYTVDDVSISSIVAAQKDGEVLVYGTSNNNGYPVNEVLKAIAYIIADSSELFGKRPKGYAEILERHITNNQMESVEMRRPDLLTPLVIVGNGRGALVGAENPDVYQKLVTYAPDNEYKLCVRPITEEDLQNA
jgi:hypothetical protein